MHIERLVVVCRFQRGCRILCRLLVTRKLTNRWWLHVSTHELHMRQQQQHSKRTRVNILKTHVASTLEPLWCVWEV